METHRRLERRILTGCRLLCVGLAVASLLLGRTDPAHRTFSYVLAGTLLVLVAVTWPLFRLADRAAARRAARAKNRGVS